MINQFALVCCLRTFKKAAAAGEKARPATMSRPQDPVVCQTSDWDAGQNPAFQFFSYAHARHESQPNTLLNEAFDRLNRGQLNRDVERRMLSRKCFYQLSSEIRTSRCEQQKTLCRDL